MYVVERGLAGAQEVHDERKSVDVNLRLCTTKAALELELSFTAAHLKSVSRHNDQCSNYSHNFCEQLEKCHFLISY